MFTIDGIQWNIPCTVERVSEIKSSEISGMLLNRQYFNDVLGTWLKYSITIAVPFGYMDQYADIYETLTQPKDGHTFILPYNNGEVTITGRVSVVSDRWVKNGSNNHWRQTKFDVIANHPTKQMSLTDVITTGLTPLPADISATVGDIYEYTQSGWVQRDWVSAEDTYY